MSAGEKLPALPPVRGEGTRERHCSFKELDPVPIPGVPVGSNVRRDSSITFSSDMQNASSGPSQSDITASDDIHIDEEFKVPQSTSEENLESDADGKANIPKLGELIKSEKDMKELQRMSEIKIVQMHPEYLRQISDFYFVEQVGSGAFGAVWLANDLRTGKVVAIKELTQQILRGRDLLLYIREIHTLALCQNRYTVPLVGYTITPPYSIITEYMPHGNLYKRCCSRKNRDNPLSGTHLSTIALTVAYGMIKLHQQGLIHRDLKSSNILLDKDGLPKLCDFGSSRVFSAERKLSKRVGTYSHMAPELYEGTAYTTKADVYSFAFTLYEMTERHNAFRTKDPAEVMDMIANQHFRPTFDKEKTSKSLKHLIRECWDDDPKKRPTFEDIFHRFATGAVHFKHTDTKKVIQFSQQLIKEDEELQLHPPPPLQPVVNIQQVIQQLTQSQQRKMAAAQAPGGRGRGRGGKRGVGKRGGRGGRGAAKAEPKRRMTSPQINKNGDVIIQVPKISSSTAMPIPVEIKFEQDSIKVDALDNPSSPEFFVYMDYMKKAMHPNQFKTFFRRVFPVIKDGKEIKAIKQILSTITYLIAKDPLYIPEFMACHVVAVLPFESDLYSPQIFRLLLHIIIHRADVLDATFYRALGYFYQHYPKESIILMSQYISQMSKVDDHSIISDHFFSYARSFYYIPEGKQFVDIIAYVLLNDDLLSESKIKMLFPILYAFMGAKIPETCQAAISAMCIVYDGITPLPFSTLLHLLASNSICSSSIISLLLRCNDYPCNTRFFNNLVAITTNIQHTFGILWKFAEQSPAHALIAAKSDRWMSLDYDHLMGYFILFAIIFQYPQARPILSKSQRLPQFLFHLVKLGDNSILISLPSIFKRLDIDQQLIDQLTKEGFFKSFMSIILNQPNDSNITCLFLMLDIFTKKGYTQDYCLVVPFLVQLLNNKCQYTASAIRAFASLSSFRQLALKFRDRNLVAYFTALIQIPDLKQYGKMFISNVSRARSYSTLGNEPVPPKPS